MSDTDHRFQWYCIIRNDAGDDIKVRRARWATPGKGFHRFEARCSCGWETHTGGAIPAYIQGRVNEHRADANADVALTEVTA